MTYQNLLVGPFLGDFESETMNFRPYAKWIQEVIKPDKMFIATHSNRLFMYDGVIPIPVYEDFSRDELNQNGLIHNSVVQKEVNLITRKIKLEMVAKIGSKKDILHFNTVYTKSPHWYPLYKKIFVPIKVDVEKGDYILYIPDIKEKYNTIYELYEFLITKYKNVVVAGDLKTHLHEVNIMLKNITYFRDIYLDMIKLITGAKVVVTPNSHWTILSLLQNTPVISWGSYPEYYTNSTPHQILVRNVGGMYLKNIIGSFIDSL